MGDACHFRDRRQAGLALAPLLAHYAQRSDAIVLALPRGGVPVGQALASSLGLSLDLLFVRKLGMPGHEEFAMGAIGSGGVCVLLEHILDHYQVAPELIDDAIAREQLELARRERHYRGARPPAELRGKVVILVDDGLATGASMRAAVELVRQRGPAKVVVGVPVGAPDSCAAVASLADEFICPCQPLHFRSVGQHYRDFTQTTDKEVRKLLARAWQDAAAPTPAIN